MIRADLHTHTSCSHARHSVDAMLEAAWAKGLDVFGLSEHSPRPEGYVYPSDYQNKLTQVFPSYIDAVLAAKRHCRTQGEASGKSVLLGLEADFLPEQLPFIKKLAAAYPFDYVIGGLHFQGNWGFDYGVDDWRTLAPERCFAVYERYYRDMALMCSSGLFQIAAHPDLIKIFTIEIFREWLKQPAAEAAVGAALAAMRKHGVALEVSSAGLRKPCREIYPGPRIMAMARQAGLAVTIGSDAHSTEDIAYAFPELEEYVRSFGHTFSLIFENGAPRALSFK